MSHFASPVTKANRPFDIRDYLPVFSWLRDYDRETFTSDLIDGGIVAIMLVPQGMAYALLAGLPPQVGLYASILPLIIYGLLGSSRSLAVGPVAMVSLLVASSIGPLASNTADYIALSITLAFMVGIMQTVMGILRVGFVVNFLSHPVLSAFTSAAAIIIGFSQLKHVLGFSVPRLEHFYEQVAYTAGHLSQTNFIALAVGAGGMLLLWLCKQYLARGLAYFRLLANALATDTLSI